MRTHAPRSEVHVLACGRSEGRHDGLAAARGEVRQQPRRRRREDADPGPHSKHRPLEKSSPSMSPVPPPFFSGRSGLFEGVPLVRRGSGFGGASCAAAAFEAAAASAAAAVAAAATAALVAAVSAATA